MHVPLLQKIKPVAASYCMTKLDLTPQKLKELMDDFNDPVMADKFIHCLYQEEGSLTQTGVLKASKVARTLSQLITTTEVDYNTAISVSNRMVQSCLTAMTGNYRYLQFYKCMLRILKEIGNKESKSVGTLLM